MTWTARRYAPAAAKSASSFSGVLSPGEISISPAAPSMALKGAFFCSCALFFLRGALGVSAGGTHGLQTRGAT